MVSLGTMLVRGLGAGMQGLGKTLLEQDADAKRKEEQQALLLREEALAQFNHGLSMDQLKATAASQVGIHAAESRIDTAALAQRLPGQVAAKVTEINATQQAEYEKEYKLLTTKQKGDMTLAQYIQAQETSRANAANAAALQRSQIAGQTERDTHPIAQSVAPDGTPIVSLAPSTEGGPPRTIKVLGARPVAIARQDMRDTDAAESAGSLTSLRQPTGGSTAAAQPGPAAPSATPDYSTYQSMLAEAAMHPEFKDLPASEVQSRIAQLARSQNIPVPPDVQ